MSSCPACLGPRHHVCNKFDRLETHLRILSLQVQLVHLPTSSFLLDLNAPPPEELDSGLIPGGMAAANDEADALAQNEGDAQEATGTTCAFAYLFFPAFN